MYKWQKVLPMSGIKNHIYIFFDRIIITPNWNKYKWKITTSSNKYSFQI